MANDDRRMHEGRSRSLDDREPRDRGNEEQTGAGDAIGAGDREPLDGAAQDVEDVASTTDRHQDSALGGHVGTRSSGA